MRRARVRKILILVVVLLFCRVVKLEPVMASNDTALFNGLYLIKGQVKLNKVDIGISVDSLLTSKVTAAYEMTNTGENTEYLNFGTPITELEMTSVNNWFTPYKYNSIVVNGSKVNQELKEVDVDFENWRNYSFDVPIKAGETKTATISFTIRNKQLNSGMITCDIDFNHLKTWGELPESVTVKGNFNAQSVKIYNFDNEFTVQPTEKLSEYAYVWSLSDIDVKKRVSFNYYLIDTEIINQLYAINSGQVNSMISAYNQKDYGKVIEIGKGYIANEDNSDNQNKVYLFMVDSYMALKEYEEALAVLDLTGTELASFGEIAQKIEDKIVYNKVICYRELKQYENMYDLIDYEVNYSDMNTYMKSWLEKQYGQIPEKDMEKIKASRKELSSVEKWAKKFLQGEYHLYLFIGIGALIVVVVIILLIRKNRRKKRLFF